jgi:hypothetical protein
MPRSTLEAHRLARLVQDRRDPGIDRRVPQRALAARMVEQERRSERDREREPRGLREVAAHLRQVRAVERSGVEVREGVTAADHVLEEVVGEARGEAPRGLPGKNRFRSRRSGR